ncbi:MAE_28990/MAE_18760 family HEPN-like nuclease, partial [Methanococcoides sp.]|uniref:MAE_28990/MAE_18760 family HEPN-like nuclease n=1 Tax=Methanococcoides sp. TaxID=1966350 RepID=UPI00272EAFCC
GDFAWRKKELTMIVSAVKTSTQHTLDTRLRAATALLYAHWEGYIKNASIYYLNYISHRNLKYENLTDNFIALALRGEFITAQQAKKTSIHIKLVDALVNNLSDEAKIPYINVIETKSNLKWEVLKEILETLGFEYSFYETKAKLIDKKLVDNRNDVAHGQRMNIEKDDFINLYKQVMTMIEYFRTQIIDSVINKTYLRNQS